jgi:hypothetical protein
MYTDWEENQDKTVWQNGWLVYGVKGHFQQYFSFIGGGNPEKTTDLLQVTDKF